MSWERERATEVGMNLPGFWDFGDVLVQLPAAHPQRDKGRGAVPSFPIPMEDMLGLQSELLQVQLTQQGCREVKSPGSRQLEQCCRAALPQHCSELARCPCSSFMLLFVDATESISIFSLSKEQTGSNQPCDEAKQKYEA